MENVEIAKTAREIYLMRLPQQSSNLLSQKFTQMINF